MTMKILPGELAITQHSDGWHVYKYALHSGEGKRAYRLNEHPFADQQSASEYLEYVSQG